MMCWDLCLQSQLWEGCWRELVQARNLIYTVKEKVMMMMRRRVNKELRRGLGWPLILGASVVLESVALGEPHWTCISSRCCNFFLKLLRFSESLWGRKGGAWTIKLSIRSLRMLAGVEMEITSSARRTLPPSCYGPLSPQTLLNPPVSYVGLQHRGSEPGAINEFVSCGLCHGFPSLNPATDVKSTVNRC